MFRRTHANSQRCKKKDGDEASSAQARKLQIPDQMDRKRNDDGISDDVRYVRADDKVPEVEALLPRDFLVPPGLHRLALENGNQHDGDPPGHNKSNHAIAHDAELAIDAKDSQVQAQYGAFDQGDIGGVVKLAQIRILYCMCQNGPLEKSL